VKKILIIDDEYKFRDIYKRSLKSEGYEVLVAENGLTAYSLLLSNSHVDLILLDINMEEFAGNKLFNLLQLFFARIKVIVTSARPLDEQYELIDNAAGYFDKSEGIDVLLEKVKKVFSKTHKRKEREKR
jgi:two-component system, OmpR family, KDP operon response regulator KdpE